MYLNYFAIFPEVSGEVSEGAIISGTSHNTDEIQSLVCLIDLWSGDCLIKASEYLIASYVVCDDLFSRLTGYEIKDVDIRRRLILQSKGPFPDWKWMKIIGVPMLDDFGIDDERRLIVSEKVLRVLQNHGLNYAYVYPAEDAPTFQEFVEIVFEAMRKLGK